MDGWDGWGSSISEIADDTYFEDRSQFSLDVAHLGYSVGRIDHGDDVRQDIAAALSRGDALDAWPGWPETDVMRNRRSVPHELRTTPKVGLRHAVHA